MSTFLDKLLNEDVDRLRADRAHLYKLLDTFDLLTWFEFLSALGRADRNVLRLFNVRSDEDLVETVVAVFRGLSADHRLLMSRAVERILISDSIEETQSFSLYLTASLQLAVDPTVLVKLLADTKQPEQLRREAGSALLNQAASPSELHAWLALDHKSEAWIAPLLISRLKNADPLRALSIAVDAASYLIETPSAFTAIRDTLIATPLSFALSVRAIVQGSPIAELVARAAATIPLWDEVFAESVKADARVRVLEGSEPGVLGLIAKLEKRNWDLWYRISGYYSGELVTGSVDPPASTLKFLEFIRNTLVGVAQQRGYGDLGEKINLVPKPGSVLDTLVDGVFDKDIVQAEPGFGSNKRGRRGGMVTIGTLDAFTVVLN